MIKCNDNILRCYGGLDMQDPGELSFPLTQTTETLESTLLREIYKCDDDGIFQGDLAMFLSEKVRPEVKDFIQENLLRPMSPVVSSVNTDGLTDDEIIALSPSVADTYDSYTERVRTYLDSLRNEDTKDS